MTTNKHIEAKPKDMPWKEARENLKMHAETFPELLADVIDSAYVCGLEATNSESYLLGQDSVREEVKNLITEEILICHHENTPTSRLTSLAMKLKNISKLQDNNKKE